MARPREFDEATVLEAAIQCFWDKGFEGSSMRDLADRMQMTGASIYNAFGDKKALFRKALDHYVDHGFDDRVRRLEGLPPRQALSVFFYEIIERSLADPACKGCMVINSTIDVAPHDPQMQEAVGEILGRMERYFGDTVRAGQADGSISKRQSPEDMARLLLGLLAGIRALARARPERDLLEGMVRPVLSLLDDPAIDERAD
jgi:TetR/AcrR family transcriptional repressor of nem operon